MQPFTSILIFVVFQMTLLSGWRWLIWKVIFQSYLPKILCWLSLKLLGSKVITYKLINLIISVEPDEQFLFRFLTEDSLLTPKKTTITNHFDDNADYFHFMIGLRRLFMDNQQHNGNINISHNKVIKKRSTVRT